MRSNLVIKPGEKGMDINFLNNYLKLMFHNLTDCPFLLYTGAMLQELRLVRVEDVRYI